MPLEQQDLEKIAEYVKTHLGEWLAEQSLGKPPAVYEIELRERMVRVEEELKHQRELMHEGFQMMEKRFEQIDKQFEQVDKHFDQVDKRFESMNQRLDRFMRWSFGLYVAGIGVILAVFWRLTGSG